MLSLRIAVALPHLGVYGGIRRFLELGRIWIRRGHSVALLTPPQGQGDESREAWLPFEGQIGALDRLAREPWDVLLSPDPRLFLEAGAKHMLRVFYAVLEKAPGTAEACRAADLVLANSTSMKRHLARRGVLAADGIGGVNVGFFTPPVPDPRPSRALAGAPVRVLVYGRLSRRRKGTWTAARAIDLAARLTSVPVELTLFDSPPPGTKERTGGLRVRVPHRWVLRPSQEDLVRLYRDADLFVSAERRAGWCNTAAEAMACGAAVVATRSGTEDFARHGETALTARWPWTWPLATRIARLLRRPEERLRLAARGHAEIQRFSWEHTAVSVEAAILARWDARARVRAAAGT